MDINNLEFLKANLKDVSLVEPIRKSLQRRARITAILLGSFLVIALVSMVYGFVQSKIMLTVRMELENKSIHIEQLTKELEKMKIQVEEGKIVYQEINAMMEERLKACERKLKN